jgi:hypothetical protein
MKFFYKFIPPFIQKLIKTTCQEKTKGGLIDTKSRNTKIHSTTKNKAPTKVDALFLVVARLVNQQSHNIKSVRNFITLLKVYFSNLSIFSLRLFIC